MARPRRDDRPQLVRNVVTDPIREALNAEFVRKLQYLKRSYAVELQAGIDRRAYNIALAKLRREIDRGGDTVIRDVGPLLAHAIKVEARNLAGLQDDAPLTDAHEDFVRQAELIIRKRATSVRGKLGKDILRRNIEGLIALIQETTGKRVMAPRDKNSVYLPHLSGTLGALVRKVVDELAPGTTDSELSFWVREAHKKYANKQMRFEDFYPGYHFSQGGRVHLHRRDEIDKQPPKVT